MADLAAALEWEQISPEAREKVRRALRTRFALDSALAAAEIKKGDYGHRLSIATRVLARLYPEQADALARAAAKTTDPEREYGNMRAFFFADEIERWDEWYFEQLEKKAVGQ